MTRTAITSTGPYKAGAVIEVTVTYGETVEVDTKSGRPSLTLEVGANERQARYARGTGSTELVFEYTVVANETDANGVVVKANSLALNSGKISDVAGNAAFLRHLAVSADTDHLVDTTAPRVLTVTWPTDTGSSSSDGITNANTVTISTPESGASWEYSVNSGTNWTPGSGNSFTLLDGTYTKDMIHVRQRDAADNPSAVSKNPTGITVDTRAPVALTMTLPRDTGSSSSDGLTKENRFTVSGVEDDASWEYSSDSGRNWTDGGSVSSFTLSDRSYAKDTIQVRQTDAAGNTSAVRGNPTGRTVDTSAPRVTNTAITSSGPYRLGDAIDVTVTYNEAVEVDTKSGTPYLTLVVGSTNQRAAYHSGKGSTDLVFRYTVQSGDTDGDGVVVTANSLILNSGKISDVAGNAAFLRHLAVSADTDHLVDTTAPASLRVSWPTDTGSSKSDGITNANRVVIGTPEAGATWEYSIDGGQSWMGGTDTSFTLSDGVYAINTIQVRQTDAVSNTSSVSKNAKQVTVDTRAPGVLTMTWPTDTGKSSSDGITKEDRVTVGGVESGASWEYSVNSGNSWTTGSGSSFTLLEGSYVKDAIQVRQTDAAGNTSVVSKHATGVTVDTTAPSVTNAEITSTGPYKAGAVIEVTVTYDEDVDVTGTPYLTLVVDSTDRRAEYQSGTGSTELVFRYTVGASETDGDGVVVTANSLTLNGGTIQGVAGNDASLTHEVVRAASDQAVDTTAPAVLTVTWPTDTGSSNSDGITNANRVTISGVEAGASWEYSVNSGTDWTAGTDTGFTLLDGVYGINTIRVRQTDAVGNTSSVSGNTEEITVDRAAPSALTMTLPSDTGTSSSDGITKENRVVISTPEVGASWEYSVNGGKDWTAGTDTDFTLFEDSYAIDAIQVRQTDEAGNRSLVNGNTTEITVDRAAPVALTMTLPADTGSSSSDGLTKENRVTISTPEVGASWEYSVNGGKDWTAGTDTAFLLSEGSYAIDAIQVRQTDAAGNTSLASGNASAITVDRAAPSVTDTAITSTGPYKAGDVIEVTVTYGEAVEVDTTVGRPSLTLVVGTNDRQAVYHSGSDSTALVFRYHQHPRGWWRAIRMRTGRV